MANSKTNSDALRNALLPTPDAAPYELDRRLGVFANVMVRAARSQGKPPHFHEGMTLEDAVIITGLPRDEAARRIAEWKRDGNPDDYAAAWLSEGAGERYLAEPKTATPPTSKILRFPLPFLDQTRAVANLFARCALFAPVKERQHFKDYVVVGEVEGVKIEIKGEQFNQDDHDMLLQLVMMASHTPVGEDVCLAVNAVLRGLGRANHKSQRLQAFAEIDRLVTTAVRLTAKGMPSITGHFIDDATTPQDQAVLPQYRRHIAYRFNPKLARFFEGAAYTLFDWQERVKLTGRGSELAKWLHLLIVGNAEQYAYKVETLREKSGSTTKDLKKFRQLLRQALDLLKEAGVITAWRIDAKDLVHIERTPSPAQAAHLAKKARKAGGKRPPRGLRKATDYL